MFALLLLSALASAQDAPAAPPTAVPAATTPAVPAPAVPATTPAVPAPAPTEAAPVLSSYVPTVVFPARAANLTTAEVRAAEILFRRRYEMAAGQAPADEERVRAAITFSDDQGLQAACLSLACTRWITLDLVRLDKEIYVTVIERDAAAVVTQRLESVANGLDALPGTFDRIARALAARVPLESVPASRLPVSSSSPTASTAPTPSTAAPRRPRSTSLPGFKLGVLGPLWPGFGLSLTNTFTWRQEKKDRFLEVAAGFTVPMGLTADRTFGMAFAEVGLSHIFPSKGGTAFYAGGGGGPRIGGYDDFGFGAGVYGQGGLMLGRMTNSRVYLQLKLGGDIFAGYINPYVVSYAGIEAGVGF